MRQVTKILPLLVLLTALMPSVISVPPIAAEFYGNITKNSIALPNKTNMTAYDQNDVYCGMFTIRNPGRFGVLSCAGDDLSTPVDEGALSAEQIRFFANNTMAVVFNETLNNSLWDEGEYLFVKLRLLHCGDNFCDLPENCSVCSNDCGVCMFCGNGVCEPDIEEACATCAQDCGLCPPPGGGEGGAGAGGAGEAEAGAGGEGISEQYAELIHAQLEKPPCVERWECSDWTSCNPAGLQYRMCEDTNKCGTEEQKPIEEQECEYIPTCSDDIQNCHQMPDGGLFCEEGVDCGGPCQPCPTCSDGIRNQGETRVDCGGPCQPCPSCFDGIRNQNETGIDCGGPCPPCRVGPVAPLPERPVFVGCGDGVCSEEERCACPADCARFPIRAVVWILSILALVLLLAHILLSRLRKHKKINKPVYLRKLRQVYIMSLFILLYVFVGAFYSYFFCSCLPTCKKFLYLPLLLVIVLTIGFVELLRLIRYDEERKIKKLQQLLKTHEKMLKKLVDSEDLLVEDIESDTLQRLSKMVSDQKYDALFDRFPELLLIRKSIQQLSQIRTKHTKQRVQDLILLKNMRNLENQLASSIEEVVTSKDFKAMTNQDVKALRQQLEVLHKHYSERKLRLSEMDKLLDSYFTSA